MPALQEFCKLLDEEFEKTRDKWEQRLNRIPSRCGRVNIPDMAFGVLDTDEPNKVIFFHSAPMEIIHRVLRIPVRRMENNLEGFCKNIKGIDCKAKYVKD
jgi:hypothetical protein